MRAGATMRTHNSILRHAGISVRPSRQKRMSACELTESIHGHCPRHKHPLEKMKEDDAGAQAFKRELDGRDAACSGSGPI